jgi:hypothetical protein
LTNQSTFSFIAAAVGSSKADVLNSSILAQGGGGVAAHGHPCLYTGEAMRNARIVLIAVMSLLILGFAPIRAKAVTVDVSDVEVGTDLVTITVPLGAQVEFYDLSAFDVYINGQDLSATHQDFPAASFFDVFVTIDTPGIYPYCYSSTPCSPTAPTGQLDVVTPAPAALPLFAIGIGGLGLFGWRRGRKGQAATL